MSDWGHDNCNDGIEAQPIDVDAAAAAAEGGDGPTGPSLYYGSVDEFVREYLRFVYRRRVDGRHRCWAWEWWRYEEAIIRLEALWRAWEHLRLDPSIGMSVWWRDHADHHMTVLMDPDGPFADAIDGETNTCKRGEPLPYVPPPEGMFPTPDDAARPTRRRPARSPDNPKSHSARPRGRRRGPRRPPVAA